MNNGLRKLQTLILISKAFDNKHYKRNLLLKFTIALAIASLFALLSITYSRSVTDNIKTIRENGNCATAILDNVSDEQYQTISNLNYVDYVARIRNFGIWYFNDKKIANCMIMDDGAFEKMYLPALEQFTGNYPIEYNEILLSKSVLQAIGINEPEIGMKISVNIVPVNWLKNNSKNINMDFRLSGYYSDFIDESESLPQAFFSKLLINQKSISDTIDYALISSNNFWISSYQIEKTFNSTISISDNQNIKIINEGMAKTLRSIGGNCVFAVAGMIIIIFSMNLFIFNIFSISFDEERHDYGLLKVIGAEPKQIKCILIASELKIMLAGIMLGTIISYLFERFVLTWIIEKMYMSGVGTIAYDKIWSGKLLVISIFMCVLGNVFAAVKCAIAIMKLTPIECLKYEEPINTINIKIIHRPNFGILNLAWRNFARNKTKMIVSVISLAIGIEVFLMTIVISHGLDQSNKIMQNPDFVVEVTREAVEYYLSLNEGNGVEELQGHDLLHDEMVSEILDKIELEECNISKCIGGVGAFSYNDSEALAPRLESWQYDLDIYTGLTIQVVSNEWLEELIKYVEKKGLNINVNEIRNIDGFLLLHGHELSERQLKEADEAIGKSLSGVIVEDDGKEFELKCCGYLDFTEKDFPRLNMPWNGKNINYIVISEDTMSSLGMKPLIYNISFDIKRNNEQVAKNQILAIVRSWNQNSEIPNSYRIIAKSDLLAKEQSYISAIKIIMGGFSGILMIFAIISYYNTLLAGYSIRKLEFFIMRTIGMTAKQLRLMLIYEGLFYYLFSMFTVLTLGNVLLYIVGWRMKRQVSYFVFMYPLSYLIFASIVMLGVSVGASVFLYCKGKIERSDL